MRPLTVSLVQTPLQWQDPPANRALLAEKLAGLAGRTDLIVLPEMFATGFTMRPEQCAEPPDGPSVVWLLEAAESLGAALTGSLAIAADGAHYNRLYWAQPDGRLYSYDKRHLFRMAGEHRHYTAGAQRLTVELGGWRICPLICYDLRFPVWSRNTDDFHVLLYVANWPRARRSSWTRLLAARAIENLCYVIGVNRIGDDGNGISYAGDSAMLDWLGEPLHLCGEREEVATVELDPQGLIHYRETFPADRDADRFRLEPT